MPKLNQLLKQKLLSSSARALKQYLQLNDCMITFVQLHKPHPPAIFTGFPFHIILRSISIRASTSVGPTRENSLFQSNMKPFNQAINQLTIKGLACIIKKFIQFITNYLISTLLLFLLSSYTTPNINRCVPRICTVFSNSIYNFEDGSGFNKLFGIFA